MLRKVQLSAARARYHGVDLQLISRVLVLALMGLHGRFFGGRKVKAEYFDEAKFGRMNLNSQ